MTVFSDRRVRLLTVVVGVAGLVLMAATPAAAQDISVNFGQGGGLTERVIQMIALLTVLSLAPSILVMMTSFTRIVVVLSLLRTALGTATAPPNAVIVSLALFLTAFVMGPALQSAYDTGIRPLVANEITAEQVRARHRAAARLRAEERARKDLSCSSICQGSRARQAGRSIAARAGTGLHDLELKRLEMASCCSCRS